MKLKNILLPLLSFSITHSQPSEWTSSDGRSATMTLIEVSEHDGQLSGNFKMANGSIATLSEDKLAASEKTRLQKKLEEQKAEPKEEVAETASPAMEDKVFPAIQKDLLVFDGKRMKRLKELAPPSKYYLFYETASWCPPCQKFTPQLVEFYDELKKKNENELEIILLSSDRSEEAQEEYSESKNMKWPQLDNKDSERFGKKFGIASRGIPALTLTDVSGKTIFTGNAYGILPKVKEKLK